MKTLTTEMQLQLLAAAGTAFGAIKRLDPPDPGALAAAGLLTAWLAPTYEELWSFTVANGLPKPDAAEYARMMETAQHFAATLATAGQREH